MDRLDFPPPSGWRRTPPQELGFDAAGLARACNYAESSEIDWPVDVRTMVCRDDPPPFNRPIGPTKPRGAASGVVVKDGQLVAEWGTPDRVDMTFSATKSYLWACVALAIDRGLIESVDDRVSDYVAGSLSTNTTLIGASFTALSLKVNSGSSAIPEDSRNRLTRSSP